MTAVLLAAGLGSRLRPLTAKLPKALLRVHGQSLLQRALTSIVSTTIRQIVIITGYRHEMIEEHLRGLHTELSITFLHNPDFALTNNNVSLLIAGPFVRGQDFVLLDSDLLFDKQILFQLLSDPTPDALVIRRSSELTDEEVKVILDREGYIMEIGKDVDVKHSAGESIGLAKFSRDTSERLFQVLDQRRGKNEFYESAFQELIRTGTRFASVDTGKNICIEIDTLEDLQHAEILAWKLSS